MAKHISPQVWLELFRLYEIDLELCWTELAKIKKVTPSTKYWFIKKYNLFIESGRDINVLISKSGFAPKKGKGSGRPPKNKKIIKQ